MKKLKVYIAAPYTYPDETDNTLRALEFAEVLLRRGYIPLVPHLAHFWDSIYQHPYKVWTEIGLALLEGADLVMRLPGYSPGADAEIRRAHELNKRVIYVKGVRICKL